MTETDDSVRKPDNILCFRHIQMLMLFLGLALAYGMRVTMSIAIVAMTNVHHETDGESLPFSWYIMEQAVVLSSFMAGYVISQVPGRRIATRFGGKVLMVVGVGGSAAVAVFIPLGAYDGNWQLVSGCRFIQGLAQGAMVPAILNLIDKWIPFDERRLMETIVFCGALFGVSLEFLVAGFVINSFGWTMAFYMNTITGTVWSLIFIIIGSKSAETSRFISEEEKLYIRSSLKQDSDPKELNTPWYALWTTISFLSLVVANCGQNWGLWTLMTLLPMYYRQTHGLTLIMSGVVSAIPYMAMFLLVLPCRYIANALITKNYFSVTTVRKMFSGIGFFGPGVGMVILAFLECNVQISAMIITLVLVLNAVQYSGFMMSHEDMAPNFSSRMTRITNGFADLLSVFAPLTAGVMLEEEFNWASVFNLCGSLYIVCGIFYLVFGTSVRQQWNEPNSLHQHTTDPKEGTHRSQ